MAIRSASGIVLPAVAAVAMGVALQDSAIVLRLSRGSQPADITWRKPVREDTWRVACVCHSPAGPTEWVFLIACAPPQGDPAQAIGAACGVLERPRSLLRGVSMTCRPVGGERIGQATCPWNPGTGLFRILSVSAMADRQTDPIGRSKPR